MKLTARDTVAYFGRPEPAMPGLLIYGVDAMRVAMKRQELVAKMIGPEGEAEMRLTRVAGAEVRKDPAQILDGLKATGFFPGTRVLLIEDAGDAITESLKAALDDWTEGDGYLVITAGQLPPRSSLRKLFEGHKRAYAAAIYDDPPSRAEIESVLKAVGVKEIGRDGMGEIEVLAQTLDPGDFRQTVEKVALYKMGDSTPLSADDVLAVAPTSSEADLDDAIDIVAESRAKEIGPLLRRLDAQGVAPVTLCIMTLRHFRTLYAAAADPDGPANAVARIRPPVHFKRRDRVVRQARRWGVEKLEEALHMLTDTDLALRSSAKAPQMAVMERTWIRLSVLGNR